MSAIGADPSGSSAYARTKAFGEAAVRQILPDAIIMRPSVVFGPEDQFFNRFAAMARLMPVLPLIGGATRLQPVFAGDVAAAIALCADGKAKPGIIYELGGPEVATLERIMRFVLTVTARRRRLVPISFARAKIVASVTEIVAKLSLGLFPEMFTMTRDQVELLRGDNIVSPQAEAEGRTFAASASCPNHLRPLRPPISTDTAKPGNSPVRVRSENLLLTRARARRLAVVNRTEVIAAVRASIIPDTQVPVRCRNL